MLSDELPSGRESGNSTRELDEVVEATADIASRFSFVYEEINSRAEQRLTIENCTASLIVIHRDKVGNRNQRAISYFQIENYEPAETAATDELLLLSRRGLAADEGVLRWLRALDEIPPENSEAEMRDLLYRVSSGEFGEVAASNRYEMETWIHDDPIPYITMPLTQISIKLPPTEAAVAKVAWQDYAREHCSRP